jgi:ATP-binding cassette subfamily B protein
MLKAIRVIAGESGKLHYVILGQIFHTILTGMPIVFLFFVISELKNPIGQADKGKLTMWCVAMAAVIILNIFVAIRVHVNTYLKAYNLSTDARLKLGDHIRGLSLGFFKERDPGEISALMLQDMTKVESLFSHNLSESVGFVVLPALMAVCFLFQDPRLSAVMIGTAAIAILILMFAQKVIDYYGTKQIASRNRAASRILEYLQGISVLKSFKMTGTGFERLDAALLELRRDCIMLEAMGGLPITLFAAVLEIGLAALIVYASWLLSGYLVPVTVFVMFMVIGPKFFEPLLNFGLLFSELRYMSLASKRIVKVLDEKPLPRLSPSAIPQKYDISITGVTFSYAPDRKVIDNLTLDLPEKSLTALVGSSGSGKTTLTSLMARFWDVNQGEISIGGVNIKNIPPDDLNAMFSFVFQDVYLFQDSIYENIRVGDKSATRERIIEVARLANCHDFISDLKDGYDTMVGEAGVTLSGGERQRISIARAILKNAPIVVLDEATASLDPENELAIQRAISALIQEKTVVVIAHRLRTVENADRVAVIDRGKVSEFGSHSELLALNGIYASLWNEQRKTGGWKFSKKAL